jgi:class 3 adenylate cyclase/tetratricopeptide (TPR) repeat protein
MVTLSETVLELFAHDFFRKKAKSFYKVTSNIINVILKKKSPFQRRGAFFFVIMHNPNYKGISHRSLESSGEDNYGKLVFCLSIDLIGSTQRGLELTRKQRNQFNKRLVEQIKPHLDKLHLANSVVKFTGDGWLIMTDSYKVSKVTALCCLAKIMAHRFKEEMSNGTELSADAIPPLRITIHSGLDISVIVPDGRRDWVGDSARKAVRASAICRPNKILIGEPVREIAQGEFHIAPVNIEECDKPEKWEQDIEPLFTLRNFKSGVVDDSGSPEFILYTLDQIGKEKEAEEKESQVSECLGNKAKKLKPNEIEARGKIMKKWNRVMAKAPNYPSICDTLKDIQDVGFAPDIFTYSILINKAPDYDEAKKWMKTMKEKSIPPNVITYSTLIKKVPDYNEAKALVDMMREEGIQPNAFTYSTLIKKAPDYNEAKALVDMMREEGIQPNVFIYNMIIKKVPDYNEAKALVDMMREEGIQPDVITYNTLIKKVPDYNEAKVLVDMMREEGIQPDVITYSELVDKAPDYNEAKVLLDMMREEGIQPNIFIYSVLFSKDLSGLMAEEIPEAFHLALGYPHLRTSRKLMREYPKEALNYFRETLDSDPQHPNADYAIGVAFMELGRELEALPHLKKALKLATADRRKKDIEERLSLISKKLHQNEHIEKNMKKLDINNIPGKYEDRVFIGGNYDWMPVLREIGKYTEENGFQPILAYDFKIENDIHHFDLRLLHQCKYAIFDETHPAGELMEIERSKDYEVSVFIIYPFEELNKVISEWLSEIRTKN